MRFSSPPSHALSIFKVEMSFPLMVNQTLQKPPLGERMEMQQDSKIQYMAALNLFSRVFQNSPDEDMLKSMVEVDIFSDFAHWDCFAPLGDASLKLPDPVPALRRLAQAYGPESFPAGDSEQWRPLYLELHQDHLALFSGPTPLAAPWESIWRERDKLLFGEQTEKVCQQYLEWGLGIEDFGHAPEDHLGLELSFLLYLLQIEEREPSRRSESGQTPQETLRAFLDEHLLSWAGPCLQKAAAEARSVFYQEMPALCELMILNLADEIKS